VTVSSRLVLRPFFDRQHPQSNLSNPLLQRGPAYAVRIYAFFTLFLCLPFTYIPSPTLFEKPCVLREQSEVTSRKLEYCNLHRLTRKNSPFFVFSVDPGFISFPLLIVPGANVGPDFLYSDDLFSFQRLPFFRVFCERLSPAAFRRQRIR